MRKLAWFSGGFALACLLFACGPGGLWVLPAAALLCAAAFGALFLFRRRAPERPAGYAAARRLAALFLGVLLASGWALGYRALFRAPAEALAGTEEERRATVLTWPEETSIGGFSVTVRLEGGPAAPDAVLYGGSGWGEVRPGDRVSCSMRLEQAHLLRGDETTYYTAKGVFLLAYCGQPGEIDRPDRLPLRFWPAACARALRRGIFTAFDSLAAPLAAAVSLGDKSALSRELYSAMGRAGVVHAAVVSGLHISFLAGLLPLLFSNRRRTALCTMPLLLFYALMAGATPSALRAVIMQLVLLAGPALGRENDPPTSLALALLILLVQNPYAAASVGLQLSFASVAGIQLASQRICRALYEPVGRRLPRSAFWARALNALWHFLTASLSATLGALLFTTPLTAYYFGRLSLVSPLANLLVLPAVTVLMISALALGLLALVLPGPAALLGRLFGLTGHWIAAVVTRLSRWPLACLSCEALTLRIWLAAVYVLVLAVVLAQRRRRQALLSLLCAAVLLGAAIGFNALAVGVSDLTVTALDVGQGASTLFLSAGSAALADCGGSSSDSPGDIAADHLAALGRRSLDALIFTHLDADHFNGAQQLFARLRIGAVYVPASASHRQELEELCALAAAHGTPVYTVEEPVTLTLGRTGLILYPPMSSGSTNEEGLFLQATCGDFDALITGDADAFVERMLIKYRPIPDIELLLVGHHGSAGSTCRELLEAVRPELAVISVGYNSYGHPAQAVLERLADAGARVLRTDRDGSVSVTLRSGRVRVHTNF